MAYTVMVYIYGYGLHTNAGMTYIVITYTVMPCVVMAFIFIACIGMAYLVMTCISMQEVHYACGLDVPQVLNQARIHPCMQLIVYPRGHR